jgi:hypothetical protein
MSTWDNPIPTPTTITGDSAYSVARNALIARTTDAGAWATWAAQLMYDQTTNITNTLSADIITDHITPLLTLLGTIPSWTDGSLGYTNNTFSDSFLTALKARLIADIGVFSTGLGEANETAMFARATERVTAERLKVYNDMTDEVSSRGFDIPPGSLTARQTELNNEASIRLTDTSTDILKETTTLASAYNTQMLQLSVTMVDVLGKVFDAGELRAFEVAKTTILQRLDGYRAELSMYETKAKLIDESSKLILDTLLREMTLELESFKGVAQAAATMVSGALNSVSSSTSFGHGSQESIADNRGVYYQLGGKIAADITAPAGTKPALTT